jgi:hypothetical protein
VVVHKCPNLYEFQAAHSSAVVHPPSEVPPAILARGCCLLSEASNLVPAAVDQPPLVIDLPLLVAPLAGDQRFVIHIAPLTSIEA